MGRAERTERAQEPPTSPGAEGSSAVEILPLHPEQWRDWRSLRLRMLAEDSEAFGTTLDEIRDAEEALGDELWRGHLRLPGEILMARRASVPVGVVRLVIPEDPSEDGGCAGIYSMWVAPGERGHGTGRALLAACADHLFARDPLRRTRLAVRRANASARALYLACGFGEIGENPEDPTELLMERRAAPSRQEAVELPTELVVRYRAVDREEIGAGTLDTPAHLDALTASVREHGLRTPLDLAYCADYATLDGNHRIAVALRLGLPTVPVHLTRRDPAHPPGHARPLLPGDLEVLEQAWARSRG